MGGPAGTLRLGRVHGVALGAHWSLLAVVAVVAGALALRRLPADLPGHGAASYWCTGVAVGVAVVATVLAHEAGHAAMATPAGLEVEGITLSWIGGVTRMRGAVGGPWWEVGVAAAGPAVSAAIGVASLVGAHWVGQLTLAGEASTWIGRVNLSLAAFNLLPAAPLDGGRIVHGILWRIGADQWRAASSTSRLGTATGVALAGLGVWAIAWRGDAIDGLTLAGVGWWLTAAARAEGRTAALARCLAGATVADLMRPVGEAPGWVTLREFVDGYAAPHPGAVWLLGRRGGGYEGVLAGDAVRRLPGPSHDRLRAIDVAVPVSATTGAAPGDDALTALAGLDGGTVVLVVDGWATIGAVLPADVARLVASGGRVVAAPLAATVARP